MASPAEAIAGVRDATCAIMRIVKKTKSRGKNKPAQVEFRVGFGGTAWCIAADRYLVTAHHILNGGKARDQNDRFYAFTVPGNGAMAYAFPVTGFPCEDPSSDLAILEIGAPAVAGQHIAAVPVTMARPPDGSRVLTYGFPSPIVQGANVDPQGNYLGGGKFFLKGHANEGIVAAQYELDGLWHFEFNVGWHHGESGGPVFQEEPLAAIAVMQHYRNIESPHGVVAGPHSGRALGAIQQKLTACNATIV